MKPALRRVSAFVAMCLVSSSRPVVPQTCSPEAFAPTGADPVTIAGTWDLPPDCTIDFGDRLVILDGTIAAEDLTIAAGHLVVAETGRIDAVHGLAIRLVAGAVHGGELEIRGSIRGAGIHGGGISVEAEGGVMIRAGAVVESIARDDLGNGGFIAIEAGGPVESEGALSVSPGTDGALGGEVSIASAGGLVSLAGEVQVSGGHASPCAITVEAAQTITVSGSLRAPGRVAPSGAIGGGVVRLRASGALELTGRLDLSGPDGSGPGEGNGGRLELDAAGDIVIEGSANLSAGPASRGGFLRARCDGSFVLGAKLLDVSGRAADSSGGGVSIEADGAIDLHGSIDALGGPDGDAGAVQAVSGGPMVVRGTVDCAGNYPTWGIELVSREDRVDVRAPLVAAGIGPWGTGGPIGVYGVTAVAIDGGVSVSSAGSGEDGLGGIVRLDSFQDVIVAPGALLAASGDPGDIPLGQGGAVEMEGCSIATGSDALVRADGAIGGRIVADASGSLQLEGSLDASADGLIQLRHPAGASPGMAGATFSPAPELQASVVLDPCLIAIPSGLFARGDCNLSAASDISDAIFLLGFLFQGAPDRVGCEKACDFNDDGELDISDSIALLTVLFLVSGETLPPPFAACGADPTGDGLECVEFGACP